jgi:hypothetical protein
MSAAVSRRLATAVAMVLLAIGVAGCVAAGGYGYDTGGLDYYEPSGGYYGGWGPGYHVGPFRDGRHFDHRVGGRPVAHAFRAAPASHAMPSIPSHARGGGRGGGGHAGGGGHGGGGHR